MRKKLDVHSMCEIALFSAIAIVLGIFAEIRVMENGGSIGITMVPLLFICLRHGFVKGFISCGVIYGLTVCIVDGYGFACYPLDYLLAFGGLAVISFFYKPIFEYEGKKKYLPYVYLTCGVFLAVAIRFLFATISGVVLWDTELVGSIAYQSTYLVPDFFICSIVLCLILKPLKKLNKKRPVVRF